MQLTWAKPCSDPTTAVIEIVAEEQISAACWHAAYTLPRHEKIVAEHLGCKELETYLPLYLAVRNWNGRRAQVHLPLFPGYVFVRMGLKDRVKVREHPSVLRLVGFNGRPAVLADQEIERLRGALALRAAEPYPFFTVGRRICVRSGPLIGLEGTVVRRKGKMRIIVSVQLIQRSVIIDLNASDLELSP